MALGLAVFAFLWFEPHKLFIDDRVDEGLPTLAANAAGPSTSEPDPASTPLAPSESTQPPADPPADASQEKPETLARGAFRPLEHAVVGQARILRLADGSLYLRFDDLSVSNGPDLRVYLSVLPAGDDWYVYDDDEFLDLGDLKGNIGNQNYRLPDDIDLSRWQSAVVWCRRFSVGFAVAPLDPD
jgi:Electron transfer DM13